MGRSNKLYSKKVYGCKKGAKRVAARIVRNHGKKVVRDAINNP